MKIGLSTCGKKYEDENFFEECKKAGIDCVEVSLPWEICGEFDLDDLRKKADTSGIELWSYHLPFCPFSENDISSTDEEKRLYSINLQKSLIQKAAAVGIKNFVIHPSAEPIDISERRDRLLCSKQSLSDLADEAEKYGAIICAEDLPRTCIGRSSYEMCELIKDDPRLMVCFDTNHLLGEYIPDFVKKVAGRIATLHVSDYDFWNERHWLPGEGNIDWSELYSALLEVGYKGPWLYEVSYGAPKSIIRSRDLTPADFANNAREIMSGKKPTPMGKPVENLEFRN